MSRNRAIFYVLVLIILFAVGAIALVSLNQQRQDNNRTFGTALSDFDKSFDATRTAIALGTIGP